MTSLFLLFYHKQKSASQVFQHAICMIETTRTKSFSFFLETLKQYLFSFSVNSFEELQYARGNCQK